MNLPPERRELDERREKSQTEVGSIFIYMQNASVSPACFPLQRLEGDAHKRPQNRMLPPLMHITNTAKEHSN